MLKMVTDAAASSCNYMQQQSQYGILCDADELCVCVRVENVIRVNVAREGKQ